MPVKSYSTIVIMPNNSNLEVTYYCMNKQLSDEKKQTRLFIQLHDCVCSLLIERTISKQPDALEKIVHTKVINTKGHLC